jgi:hypothetical protein
VRIRIGSGEIRAPENTGHTFLQAQLEAVLVSPADIPEFTQSCKIANLDGRVYLRLRIHRPGMAFSGYPGFFRPS